MSAANIRIGNQTSCHAPALLPYEFAVAHGFDAFEWLSDKGPWGWCEEDMRQAKRAELRRTAQQRGMLFSVHTPVAADPTTSSGAEAIRRSIRFGGDVGAGVIKLHLFPEHGAKPFAEALRPLMKEARSTGVRLCLENTPQTSADHFNAFFAVLAAMPEATGQVGMCLDSGRQPVCWHAQRLPRVCGPARGARPHHPLACP